MGYPCIQSVSSLSNAFVGWSGSPSYLWWQTLPLKKQANSLHFVKDICVDAVTKEVEVEGPRADIHSVQTEVVQNLTKCLDGSCWTDQWRQVLRIRNELPGIPWIYCMRWDIWRHLVVWLHQSNISLRGFCIYLLHRRHVTEDVRAWALWHHCWPERFWFQQLWHIHQRGAEGAGPQILHPPLYLRPGILWHSGTNSNSNLWIYLFHIPWVMERPSGSLGMAFVCAS